MNVYEQNFTQSIIQKIYEEIKKSKGNMDVKEEVLSQENSEEDKISEMEKVRSEEGNEDIYETEENYEKIDKITYNNYDYQNHKSEKNDSNKEIEEENDNNIYIVNLKYNIPSIKNIDKIREKEKTLVVIDHTTGVEDYFSQWIQIENRNNVLSGKILK